MWQETAAAINNCDGKDDHIQINQALKYVSENSAYNNCPSLKGPFTYVINETLLIGNNTILRGLRREDKACKYANWMSKNR